jgi:4-alpha-glucanotransferase
LDIQAEARAAGILTEYHDARGQHLHVPDDVLSRVLAALPKLAAQATEPLVLRTDLEDANVAFDLGAAARWRLSTGERELAEGSGAVHVPGLQPGVYRLDVEQDGAPRASRTLVVAPAMAYQGTFDSVWVLAVQLYSLRSQTNWGIGDFGDLKRLIEIAVPLGCAGIGLNPLHALFDSEPSNASPYAPNSRLFLNPVYIDVAAVPEFTGVDGSEREAIEREKAGDLIDHDAVWRIKLRALRRAFDSFKARGAHARVGAFEAFRTERGAVLARFSCFEALRKQFGRPWWEWPDEYRTPSDDLVRKCRSGVAGTEMEFVEYLQWNAHAQLRQCADLAVESHMKIGLYLDVAVGVRADGFDAWLEQGAISRQLSVGAPPDMLNVAGQDWGLCGFNAQGLAARAFEPFRAMIGASAHYAGAIRLDHVLGLNRLYLVPAGFSPRDGAYVRMPLDALLGVAALESQLHRCIVIGEDLGTVPEGFREKLADWGVWSYKVMMFEREWGGAYLAPDRYPPQSLATFNTHDLAPFAAWREGRDLAVKRAIGLDPGESDEERRLAVSALEATLGKHGVAGRDFPAVVEFLARAGSRILSVALDDILGVVDQINVPGTVEQHPNWRHRLRLPIESLSDLDQLRRVGAVLSRRTNAG